MNIKFLLQALFVTSTLSSSAYAQDDSEEPVTTSEEAIDQLEEAHRFAQALTQFQSSVTWTGYGDLTVTYKPGEVFQFDAAHFNPILGARLSDRIWAELELEFEHSGSEIKVEYGILDYRIGSGATVRMGQFLVPIGQFNEILHPSFRWNQVSRPAMFRSIIPAVWSDVGLQMFGDVSPGTFATLGYNLAVINGLGVHSGDVFDATGSEPLRGLRTNRRDSNMDKALVAQGRVRLGRGEPVGDTTVRLSGYTGAVSEDESDRLTLANVALESRLGPVKINAEGSKTLLDGASLEEGLYALASVEHGRTAVGARWDHVTTSMNTAPVTMDAAVGSVKYAPHLLWNLRAELAYPLESDAKPVISGMSAFYF